MAKLTKKRITELRKKSIQLGHLSRFDGPKRDGYFCPLNDDRHSPSHTFDVYWPNAWTAPKAADIDKALADHLDPEACEYVARGAH